MIALLPCSLARAIHKDMPQLSDAADRFEAGLRPVLRSR